MRLRIQDSILLKEYSLSYTDGLLPDTPLGWTPDDTLPEVQAHADELHAEWIAAGRFAIRDFALETAALRHSISLHEQKKSRPGWMVIGVGEEDRDIRRVYRELFVELNGGECRPACDEYARYPPDGFYVFENGVMRPEESGE